MTVLHRDIGDTFGDLGGTLRRVGGAGEALARSTAPVPKKESVDPRVRLAITQWPPDAPRGAVTTFVPRTASRARRSTRSGGAASPTACGGVGAEVAAAEVEPSKLADEVKRQAIGVRAALDWLGGRRWPTRSTAAIADG